MTPKLCLNMIVKNESKIITRLLESVVSIVDSFLIVDTGSTDNTEEIILRFFTERGISGKIIHESFQNFGYNRTHALQSCENLPNADYLLLLDADMQLKWNPSISPQQIKEQLKDDLYFIYQGNEYLYYKNARIVKNNRGFTYWGVTHEYVRPPDNVNCVYNEFDKSTLFIYDVGDGGSKQDKYTRDIQLLKRGLEELPNNDRYLFYLANSYRDTHQFELAIETYKQRIQVGGWFEEVWQCHYNIGKCFKMLNQWEPAIFHWLEAYEVYPSRLENLYEIIHYYREIGKHNLAYQFYCIADKERKRFKGKMDFLFLEKDVYDWKLDYEMTVIAFYRNTKPFPITHLCMKVLCYPFLEYGYTTNIISNYKFYSKKLMDVSVSNDQKWTALTTTTQKFDDQVFYPSTPSFCVQNGELISLIRYVNYRILEDGSYQNQSHIETRNVISIVDISTHPKGNWIKKRETVLTYDTSLDGQYVGLEDVRLFSYKDKVLYNANRGINGIMKIEHGTIDAYNGKTQNSVLLSCEKQSPIEKNWVLFADRKEVLRVVHSWHPLLIGELTNDTTTVFSTLPSPSFFKGVRGSTNGIRIQDEIWFVCHTVNYEDKRYYYHLFVVLDAFTFVVKRYSPYFTFEGYRVEYCLGLHYFAEKNELFLGYSLLDKETKYMMISKESVEFCVVPIF